MKLIFDNYINGKFNQKRISFDTTKGILYGDAKELPSQNRNKLKLKKLLENHPDNDEYQQIVYIHLLTFQSPIYRLQSNSYLITFKDADPCGWHLKCKKV